MSTKRRYRRRRCRHCGEWYEPNLRAGCEASTFLMHNSLHGSPRARTEPFAEQAGVKVIRVAREEHAAQNG